jgi:hypothetical protein
MVLVPFFATRSKAQIQITDDESSKTIPGCFVPVSGRRRRTQTTSKSSDPISTGRRQIIRLTGSAGTPSREAAHFRNQYMDPVIPRETIGGPHQRNSRPSFGQLVGSQMNAKKSPSSMAPDDPSSWVDIHDARLCETTPLDLPVRHWFRKPTLHTRRASSLQVELHATALNKRATHPGHPSASTSAGCSGVSG